MLDNAVLTTLSDRLVELVRRHLEHNGADAAGGPFQGTSPDGADQANPMRAGSPSRAERASAPVERAHQADRAAQREASRVANALRISIGPERLTNAQPGGPTLQTLVNQALASAGIKGQALNDLGGRVASALRAQAEPPRPSPVTTRPEPPEPRDERQRQPARGGEANAPASTATPTPKLTAPGGARPEILSDRAYLSRLLLAGVSRPGEADRLAARQLDEQVSTNRKLDALIRAIQEWRTTGDVARFARGRS